MTDEINSEIPKPKKRRSRRKKVEEPTIKDIKEVAEVVTEDLKEVAEEKAPELESVVDWSEPEATPEPAPEPTLEPTPEPAPEVEAAVEEIAPPAPSVSKSDVGVQPKTVGRPQAARDKTSDLSQHLYGIGKIKYRMRTRRSGSQS